MQIVSQTNDYSQKTSLNNPINTGLISFILAKIIPIKILTIAFWIFIISVTTIEKNIIGYILAILLILIGLRTVIYKHEEVYFGLPFLYFAWNSKNEYVKIICSAIAFTVRPIYLLFSDWKTTLIALPVAMGFYVIVWTWLGDSFITYNNITNFFKVNYLSMHSHFVLDYALLFLLPLIWLTRPKRDVMLDDCSIGFYQENGYIQEETTSLERNHKVLKEIGNS